MTQELGVSFLVGTGHRVRRPRRNEIEGSGSDQRWRGPIGGVGFGVYSMGSSNLTEDQGMGEACEFFVKCIISE